MSEIFVGTDYQEGTNKQANTIKLGFSMGKRDKSRAVYLKWSKSVLSHHDCCGNCPF